MDPHPKAYSAIQWWLLTPSGDFVCYNEWPNFTLLGAHYDEVRNTQTCPYTPEMISRFIHVLDGSRYGIKILNRFMDPRFGRSTEGEYGRGTESLMSEYAKYNLVFELPPSEFIEVQRDRVRDLLRYEKSLPINQYNKPKIYWMPHCLNSIRAIQRHHWAEPKPGQSSEKEAEMHKDFIDPLRYLLAALGDKGFISATKPKKYDMPEPTKIEHIHDTALV
jgi:hypothetical protein